VKYRFDWDAAGSHDYSDWTDFVLSGQSASISNYWGLPGTYVVKAQARDEYNATGVWSSGLTVIITGVNNPPNTPSIPVGPSTIEVGQSGTYSTSATDPDWDTVKYGWDWNGDDVIDEWTSFYSSGATCSISHSWSAFGVYTVKVMAEDLIGARSNFSSAKTVVINNPPNKPNITGPTSGKCGTPHQYSSNTTDPDGNQVYYWFNWGDGTSSGWIGPFNSGQPASISHVWNTGTYKIKVKAKDDPNGDGDLSEGLESEWSDPLPISIPKNKSINTSFLWFLENHPYLLPILRYLLGL